MIGSSIIEDKITLVLDLQGICEFAEPNCFRQKPTTKVTTNTKRKILLAEDTPLYQKIAMSYLTSEGYEVLIADDGKIAFDILSRDSEICALVTDIEMPNMNGYELTQVVRSDQRFKTLPIVAVTSISNKAAIDRGLKCGIDKWLIKIDKMALLKTLDELLSNSYAD